MRTGTAYRRRRAGVVFAVALWMLTALTALALAMALTTRTQRRHAANVDAAIQARYVEAGALRYVLRGLRDSGGKLPSETELPCCAMEIGGGAFWVIRPDDSGDGQWHYGLADEGGKIDLNAAPLAVLQKLPNITAEVAAAIVDWRDGDDVVTESGAESDFYLRKPEPYEAKNGPFETPGELRLLAGADDVVLYGEDTNRNGMLDEWEDDGPESEPADDRDGKLDRGVIGWTSPFIRWPQQQSGGQAVDVNTAAQSQLRQALGRSVDSTRAAELADLILRRRPFPSLFHLYYRCGLTMEEFQKLETTLSVPARGAFRLNVNAAGLGALMALPGLEETDAEALLQARPSQSTSESLAWMIEAIPEEKLLAAATVPLTGRSYQYVADIVSVTAGGRAFRRCRYVIDASGQTPRVIYRQNLTHWGWPLEPEILDALRSGRALSDVVATLRTQEAQ